MYSVFLEFFMFKVLGLGFFYYKVITYFYIFFGLGLDLEINQGFQPPATPFHLVWFRRTNNGRRLGQNGNVKLALTLSHIVPNGCRPNI
jgi:hypothetical protein